MKSREVIKTTIEYILVANGSPLISSILVPDAFKNEVLEILQRCPMDLLQMCNSLNFFELYNRNLFRFGYNLNVFNISEFHLIKRGIDLSEQVQVFFLDGTSEEHKLLYHELIKKENSFRFFYFYNKPIEGLTGTRIITSPVDFVELITKESNTIKQVFFKDSEFDFNHSVSTEYREYNEEYYFKPTRSNYCLINRLIGDFRSSERIEYTKAEIEAKQKEESMKAFLVKETFQRQNLFIKQLNKIDYFLDLSYNVKLLKSVNTTESILSPLILVMPFHNADLKEIHKDKGITSCLLSEQTENYLNVTKQKNGKEELLSSTIGIDILMQRLNYLDNVASLHSSLTYSPIIRTPVKGSSIYVNLSFFKPQFFPNTSQAKTRRKLKKTIYKFGNVLQQKNLSPEVQKVIKNRHGQIVAISDLPVEWTLIDGIPLAFTHDICRLPETTLHGLMSHYIRNQKFEYSIPIDIIKKTLVVLGAHEESFKKWHRIVYSQSEADGFHVVECSCLQELNDALLAIKPEFLIFDCHGGYNQETHSSFLQIGNEVLDGEYVVNNNISAPIVFLSACGTAPTYGTINPIANAFFEAGAISVTSTYLPINIDSGSKLYIRILNNLAFAADKIIHKNWLEFICHLIRSSSINDAFTYVRKRKANIDSSELKQVNSEVLYDSLIFSKRRELYSNLDKKIGALTGDDKLYYSEVIPEYLLYSNLGRGDLILFDKWETEYKRKNFL